MAAKSYNSRFYRLDEEILEFGNGVWVTPTGEEFLGLILQGGILSLHPSLSQPGLDCFRLIDNFGYYLPAPANWRDYKHTEIPVG